MEQAGAVFLVMSAPAVGSFLGTVVLRLPVGQSITTDRSRCPHCHEALRVRDLVPVVSWLLSRGRCRSCGVSLGMFYPGVELAALAVAVWSVVVFPFWLAVASCALGWTLLAAAEIDRRHYWLPDILVLPLIPAGLVVIWLAAPENLPAAVLGAAAGYGVMAVIAWGYRRFRGREGLGLGDAKLFAAAGAWTTWTALPSVLLIAALGGLLAAVLFAARGGTLRQDMPIAFGPFLAAGFWLVWSFGPILPAS